MQIRSVVLPFLLAASISSAQQVAGFKNEYLADFGMISKQLLSLAEAVPEAKFSWSPGKGIRSVSEVYVHIAAGNFLLLGFTGVKRPAEYYPTPAAPPKDPLQALIAQTQKLEKIVTAKADVMKMLKSSLDLAHESLSNATAADLDKPVDFFGQKTTARRIYLRIMAHVNEHYGQSIAYARMNGIAPPWSRPQPPQD